jgi:hypothetical protein
MQQKEHQRKIQPLFRLVERLWDKIDKLKETRPATSDYDGEDNNLPPRDGERGGVTVGDKSEHEEEGH